MRCPKCNGNLEYQVIFTRAGKLEEFRCIACGDRIDMEGVSVKRKPTIEDEEREADMDVGNGRRKCNKCGAEHPATKEFFCQSNNCSKGITHECHKCRKERGNKRYKERQAKLRCDMAGEAQQPPAPETPPDNALIVPFEVVNGIQALVRREVLAAIETIKTSLAEIEKRWV